MTHLSEMEEIDKRLRQLPPEKLATVNDFLSQLLAKQSDGNKKSDDCADETAIASEAILQRDWNRAEEDVAWAHL